MALGLSPFAVQRLVVVPQALRAVIPALVGQFITLFKDTSLVSTIGLVELLGVAQAIPNQPQFLGQGQAEVQLCVTDTGEHSVHASSPSVRRPIRNRILPLAGRPWERIRRTDTHRPSTCTRAAVATSARAIPS